MKELFTGCARLNLSRVVGLFGFIYKVCYYLFNGVVYLFVDGELRFEPSSLRLPTLPFQLTELLRKTAEPGRRLPCTDCATAERGVLVKDRTISLSLCIYIYLSIYLFIGCAVGGVFVANIYSYAMSSCWRFRSIVASLDICMTSVESG